LKAPKVVQHWINRFNNELNSCLDDLDAGDAQRLRKLFGSDAPAQAEHRFFEVICGAWLAGQGLRPRYECELARGQTPDWHVTLPARAAVVEVANVDPAREVRSHLSSSQSAITFDGDRTRVLAARAHEKATKYLDLTDELDLPFVLAIHASFLSAVTLDDVRQIVADGGECAFKDHRQLSGIIWYQSRLPSGETSDYWSHWHFTYLANPFTGRPWTPMNG
jgi:hypothetical protein